MALGARLGLAGRGRLGQPRRQVQARLGVRGRLERVLGRLLRRLLLRLLLRQLGRRGLVRGGARGGPARLAPGGLGQVRARAGRRALRERRVGGRALGLELGLRLGGGGLARGLGVGGRHGRERSGLGLGHAGARLLGARGRRGCQLGVVLRGLGIEVPVILGDRLVVQPRVALVLRLLIRVVPELVLRAPCRRASRPH